MYVFQFPLMYGRYSIYHGSSYFSSYLSSQAYSYVMPFGHTLKRKNSTSIWTLIAIGTHNV
jgi:hypothetical protein